MSKYVIVIPARYGSTRFPGKPLALISGKTMIERTYDIAKKAASKLDCEILVSTESEKILDFCIEKSMNCIITSNDCKTGTDRVCETIKNLDYKPDFILNLQGDAPLTPPWFLQKMIEEFEKNSDIDIVTPGYRMKWDELDKMRKDKKETPFTGTTIIMNQSTNDAIWFSKNIIPVIRKEEKYREQSEYSPVIRHIGLYGYSYDMMLKVSDLKESYYEKYEGLEQLRFIENGYKIKIAIVDYRGRPSSSGVDNLEDIRRAEEIIEKYGEL